MKINKLEGKKRLPCKKIFNRRGILLGCSYQKTSRTDFKGTNSVVNELLGVRRIVRHALSHNEHHKTRNGWYSGMVVPIYSIVGIILILAI